MFNSCVLSKYTVLLGQEEKSVTQSFTASVGWKCISLMSLSSDGCIYETFMPTHPSDPEKNQSQRVVRSVLLKTVVSGKARIRSRSPPWTKIAWRSWDHLKQLVRNVSPYRTQNFKHYRFQEITTRNQ